MSNSKLEKEKCDWCGKVKEIQFANIAKQFCSSKCTNAYLEHEGIAVKVTNERSHHD